MEGLTLHDAETEEILGTVIPTKETNDLGAEFNNEVWRTWKEYNEQEDYEYIDVFCYVHYHNENSKVQIERIHIDFIQISKP